MFSVPSLLCRASPALLAIAAYGTMPLPASAQTQPTDPQAARVGTNGAGLSVGDAIAAPNSDTVPLATGRSARQTPSQNEIYNSQRAADGRLGVRLGNDVSVRVSTSPLPPPRR